MPDKNHLKRNSREADARRRAARRAKRQEKIAAHARQSELSLLRKELAREKRQSARLKRQILELRHELSVRTDAVTSNHMTGEKDRESPEKDRLETFSDTVRAVQSYKKRYYPSYLIHSLSGASFFKWIRTAATYLRGMRAVRVMVTVISVLTAILTTTVISAIYLVYLPILLVGTALLFSVAGLRSLRMNHRMRKILQGQHIRVIIPCSDFAWDEQSFLVRQAQAMAREEGTAVFVVSPYIWSGKGLGGHGFFFTLRTEQPNLYLARKHYYFSLRRNVLEQVDENLTVLYV